MSLQSKKLEMDLLKAKAARAELEFKIAERLAEIERIKTHIELQEKRIKEVEEEMATLAETEA